MFNSRLTVGWLTDLCFGFADFVEPRFLRVVCGFLFVVSGLPAGQMNGKPQVLKIDQSQVTQPLGERWKTAKNLASKNDASEGYWIGYCISRMMEKNSYIGSFDTRHRDAISLFETVYGYENEADPKPDINDCCGEFSGTMTVGNSNQKHEKMVKKIGVLVRYDGKGKQLHDVKVSNMSLHVNLDEKPIVWLESAEDNESIELLSSLFSNADDSEIKEDVVRAIGLHRASKEALSFLKAIVEGKEEEDVREEAVFWIGQQETDDVLPFLTRIARNDNSEDVREKAIFSISEVESEAAIDSLISLSRKGHDKETRSKALFWLAEKASKKALKTIKDVLDDDDEDTEVQRQALFALTQANDDENESVDELIKIAKTHHNRKIRKEAIFWLGQSESPKAVDALVEIVKK
ncbi:MAG: HEAT repeat domain-containing protein [Bacteroidetes bacterium]|nr:MAG: HEAT repeat domain-containing protein [Bacteroidota bacterium]